jgi:hypothetical protein
MSTVTVRVCHVRSSDPRPSPLTTAPETLVWLPRTASNFVVEGKEASHAKYGSVEWP